MYRMKITREIKKKLINFDFKYADRIEGSVYHIHKAKDIFPNPQTPHTFSDKRMCFWHDDCIDHACCIDFKDILIF